MEVLAFASVGEDIEHQGPSHEFTASESSFEAIRFKFNPSALGSVTRLKILSSLFIAECERQRDNNPLAAREFAVAITNMQTASMWSVLGATKDTRLP